MKLSEIDNKERIILIASMLFVVLVFASSLYIYFNPPVTVLETKIFDVYQGNGNTLILTYGEGKLKLNGVYDIEIGATYRITYQSSQRNLATNVISVEKIS